MHEVDATFDRIEATAEEMARLARSALSEAQAQIEGLCREVTRQRAELTAYAERNAKLDRLVRMLEAELEVWRPPA